MTALVVLLAVVVAVLAVLVVGLLRSHALILRQLHELGAGIGDPSPRARGSAPATSGSAGTVTTSAASMVRPVDGMPGPNDAPTGRLAADVVGVDLRGDAVALRVVEAGHDTVLAFLSSTCLTCARFWDDFRDRRNVHLPAGARLAIVTKGPEEESPSALADLAPPGTTVVLSSDAWVDHDVPGSPYVIFVDGASGRIRGEGTGGSWPQVAALLAQATGDLAFTGARGSSGRRRKARADVERESDIDAALLAAGVLPGDERLYQTLDGQAPEPAPDTAPRAGRRARR